MKPICIYHGNCADGFGAAWAVWKRFPDWEFYPGVYQQDPPDVTGRDVVIVDFSYKRPVLKEMSKQASSILILDHHKTAAEDLADLIAPTNWENHQVNVLQDGYENADINGAILYAVFDMERSGAMIAWSFFHPDTPAPKLIEHIQDRDLWQFKLDGTREIQANVFSYPYDFDVWDKLMTADVADLAKEGAAIERKHHKDIAELVKVCARPAKIDGYRCWIASLPYTLTSDAGHLMCGMPMGHAKPDFAACYWDTPEGRVFSLRSVGDFDVSSVAEKFGGGGHKNAAGFKVPFDRLELDGVPNVA